MADDEAPVYEARYGWDRRTVGILALCAVFTAALLLPDMPLFARILGLPLFGGGGLFMAFVAMSRKVAFRVDGTGVLLGGSPARYGATTAHVPWSDITGFVFWRQRTGSASLPYVGVTRREGAPPLPGEGRTAHAVLRHLVPVPPEVAMSSRAVNGWRLDRDRFAAAVAHFAPGLPVYEQS
ncbi:MULTISPECIES: hypothetical protein [Streptomyces]|uniref:hypothetical protein n=1 Tax=Streptomyces TaxID=1883 RepID=UPI00117C0207|nr:hypothetical protein [Streptomyces viridochromogenes]